MRDRLAVDQHVCREPAQGRGDFREVRCSVPAVAGPQANAIAVLPREQANAVVLQLVGGPQRLEDESLDLVGRGPRHRSSLALTPLGQNRGDVVAVADAGPLGRARGHAVAAIVKEPADQQGARGGAPGACAVAIGGELLLDRLKHRPRDDRGVLPRMACAAVVELAEVDPVAQHMRERAVAERDAPDGPARAQPAPSRDDAALPQLALQRREGSELKIALEDQPHRRGLIVPDHELALPHLVSERHDAADPNALPFRGRDLVADALASNRPRGARWRQRRQVWPLMNLLMELEPKAPGLASDAIPSRMAVP